MAWRMWRPASPQRAAKSPVGAEPGVLRARPPDVDVADRARVQPPERRRPRGAGKGVHAVAEMPAVQAVEGWEGISGDDDADVFGDPRPRRDVVDPAQRGDEEPADGSLRRRPARDR